MFLEGYDEKFCFAFSCHTRDIWKELNEDINNVLMRSYERVPRRWFFIPCGIAFILAFVCYGIGFGPKQGQGFPLAVILASCVIAFPLVVPVGIFIATTSQVSHSSLFFTKKFPYYDFSKTKKKHASGLVTPYLFKVLLSITMLRSILCVFFCRCYQ